jgi:uncharacterized Fe-S cluster-containing radical SAM superfamily enzyme
MERWGNRSEDEYDAQLERLVDVDNLSYEEARQLLGKPPYELAQATEVCSSLARSAIELLLDEYDLANEPDAAFNDRISAFVPYRRKSDAQQEVDAKGRDRIRRAMAA